MNKRYVVIALAGFLCMSQQAFAEDSAAPTAQSPDHHQVQGDHQKDWQKLSPEERDARKAAIRQKMKSMSPDERKQFLSEIRAKMQERYEHAPPEMKQRMKEHMDRMDERMKHPEHIGDKNDHE